MNYEYNSASLAHSGFVIRTLLWVRRRCTGPKRTWLKTKIAKLVVWLSTKVLRLISRLPLGADGQIELIAQQLILCCATKQEIVNALTAYVHKRIAYFDTGLWLKPERVLKLGFGDCKNQAALLYAMLQECGIAADIRIGLTGKNIEARTVHACVRVVIDKVAYYCDSTASAAILCEHDLSEYHGGFLDITHEYLLKEPNKKVFGINAYN